MGIFSKIKQALGKGLQKTKSALFTDVRDLFKKEGRLVDDAFLDDLLEVLIKTDMGLKAAREIVGDIKTTFRARVVHFDEILVRIRQKLNELLAQAEVPINYAAEGTTVILVVGVNGSGKTTSIAKLAYMLKSQGKSVILGAGDTFRAAAVEQLTVWAGRLGVEIITGEPKSHPATVAYKTVETALAKGVDVAIVDTAGRLTSQHNLMQELTKVHTVIAKQIPVAPHETLLIVDATTGQGGIRDAQGFSEAAKCTGIVLAKLDGTAKGGVVVPIRQELGIPVKFVGVGEKLEDLEVFDSQAFTAALFEGVEATGAK